MTIAVRPFRLPVAVALICGLAALFLFSGCTAEAKAELSTYNGINAIRAVLPKDLLIAAVGGVSDTNFAEYVKGGITAFGLGSSLYKPGMSAEDVIAKARITIEAYDRAVGEAA